LERAEDLDTSFLDDASTTRLRRPGAGSKRLEGFAQTHVDTKIASPGLTGIALASQIPPPRSLESLQHGLLSFKNKGLQGTFFRYICDNGTYVAYYDDLEDGE
jgi:hypothetical protein